MAKAHVRMRHLASLPVLLVVLLVLASWAGPVARADDDRFLPPEQVFKYTVAASGDGVAVHWSLPPGYYAYKGRMSLESATPGAVLGAVQYPKGEVHKDEYFGALEVFRGNFVVSAPVTLAAGSNRTVLLKLKIQGCADAGLCYPPQLTEAKVELPAAAASGGPGRGIDALFAAHRAAQPNGDFLPPDDAFAFDAAADGPDRVRLTWQIADGYYLYRSRIKVEAPGAQVQLGRLQLPAGIEKTDEFFGKQEIYHGELASELPIARASNAAIDVPLDVTYQGCAEAGLCYQPIKKSIRVHLPAGSGSTGFVSEQDRLAGLIRSGNLFLVLGTFFGLGLLLAFTPCVLPMVPILSGIIAGQGNVSTGRAVSLSLVYVLGMAITYTVAGALFAAAGQQVQAVFQQPWIVVLFALLFVVLALSMFGLFTLQVPAALQTRLAAVSNRQRAGSFVGVAVMGALSALIITTCVAPPLVATLAVIGQSGDMVRGAAALFAMSLGMGVPLLVVGASAGRLLPKAGAWMDTVKQLFGVMMLAVAAWMLARIVPEGWTLLLWAVPALVGAAVLWRMRPTHPRTRILSRAAAGLAALYGVALLAGVALGSSDPLEPLPVFGTPHPTLEFKKIKSLADLNAAVAQAHAHGAAVLLDFYADWCVSCKEMERYTFADPSVQRTLTKVVLLRADVTRNDAQDQELLKHFGIFGPPTIAFYSADGQEQRAYRVVGYMKAPEFDALARQALFGARSS
jgi:thiol:disulfide interchange protein DsbD